MFILTTLFLFILILVYWKLLPFQKRSLFLLICSFIFISLLNLIYAVFFLVMTITIYFAGKIITEKQKSKKIILQIALSFLIVNLFFHKFLLPHNWQSFSLYSDSKIILLWPLGLSYVTFRLIHYMVEKYRNNVPETSFIDFASYILFFPTFLAGPVERFPDFQSQTAAGQKFDILSFNYGLYRIISGIVKKFFFADNLARLIMPVINYPQNYTRIFVILSIYGLAVRIYMDFSGYTDIALGVSRLFGYKIMENFNKPFFQKNIALFWRNWHISVYSWIRDYFFFPLFGYRASNLKIYLGIFCTMIVFMLWHELSLNFLVLGIYNGAGLIVWYCFQELKKKNITINRLFNHRYLNPLAIFLTFSFVSFSFIFFSLDIRNAWNVIKSII